jgi:hypothetical protein
MGAIAHWHASTRLACPAVRGCVHTLIYSHLTIPSSCSVAHSSLLIDSQHPTVTWHSKSLAVSWMILDLITSFRNCSKEEANGGPFTSRKQLVVL